jgi:aspartyl-tRNA(Asn)/glutamyl-tRNA(Gln) amidotransferase subunit A
VLVESRTFRRHALRLARRGADVGETYERTRAAGFGDEVKRRILIGTYALSSGYYDAYYVRAQKARTLIAADFARAFAPATRSRARPPRRPAFEFNAKSDPSACT